MLKVGREFYINVRFLPLVHPSSTVSWKTFGTIQKIPFLLIMLLYKVFLFKYGTINNHFMYVKI